MPGITMAPPDAATAVRRVFWQMFLRYLLWQTQAMFDIRNTSNTTDHRDIIARACVGTNNAKASDGEVCKAGTHDAGVLARNKHECLRIVVDIAL